MGIHKISPTRNARTPRAHLGRKDNGDIYSVYKLGFTKDASRFEYCFIGADMGRLTFDGIEIPKHPKFKNINDFEAWCSRYCAEHDVEQLKH